MTDKRTGKGSGDMSDSLKNAGDQMRATGAKAAESTQELNGKILDQAETNVREAFAALRAAANANSVGDILKVQGDYVREQGARSMAQVKEIGDLIAQFGRDAMSGMRKED